MSRVALDRLTGAPWLAAAAPFFHVLDGAEGRTRAVGGIVRDTLLGLDRVTTDIDLATELVPEEVMARAQAAGISAYPTGLAHGTVTLVAGGQTAEVTTLREDVETFGRKARVVFGTDWLRDASRRDFTMNALYAAPGGVLFDPLEGLGDCVAGRVRFIGDPDRRIAEDGLRIYRYFRFSATHGAQRLDPEAIEACRRAVGQLEGVSAERIGAEMIKMFAAPRIGTALSAMVETGVVSGGLLSGEGMAALSRYEAQNGDVAPAARLAILIATGTGADVLKSAWRLSNAVVNEARALCEAAGDLMIGNAAEVAYRMGAARTSVARVAAALRGGDEAWLDERLARLAALDPPSFPVAGGDLVAIGYRPGPELGAEIRRLEALWIASEYAHDKAALLSMTAPPPDSGKS
ncbi:CCA tRNA nucleotidyltransferase [Pelagibacterium montanilacus]|uniref:CCA tRNA nucleotidyltransferase n=1 Tax=Pelagibacterium montanilacus TaxID=2185280 RepID=UPI000F8C94B1|nr:CCA tRNA nucleotidyltransferase [Pelagibacterium montanilacus]